MDRLHIDILGISDVRWKHHGEHRVDNNHVMYYSGSEESSNMHDVAVIINTRSLNTPITFVPVSNRAMMIQIQSKPLNLNIIQLYAPTTEGTNEDVEEFYKQTEQLIKVTKKHDINIILGDMNAKVGRREVKGTVGKYGLGERNDRGDRLVQFCQDQDFVIMNTYFQLPHRRLYTWTSPLHKPDRIVRNQIDYIMINSRFRNCVKSAKTYPGADIRSDHNPVVAEMLLVLKSIRKRQANNRANIRKISCMNCKSEVIREINKWATEAKQSHESVEQQWYELKTKVHKINADILKPDKWVAKELWMTEKIYQLMEKRRLHKNDDELYKSTDIEIRREVRYARNTWYSEKCDRLEELHNKHDAFNLHKEIRAMVGKKYPTHQLVDANNLPVLDPEEKKRIWEKYIKNMFADASRSFNADTNTFEGLPILKDEVRKALLKAKTGKAAGPDNVYVEVLK
ncbi:craniofacial development protein 2-like [Battus philenor]|uniref:craniofacial development protein 2-like n=1 Tax=Battus philenor TaxID=42288 RepID=UPI0035D0A7FC